MVGELRPDSTPVPCEYTRSISLRPALRMANLHSLNGTRSHRGAAKTQAPASPMGSVWIGSSKIAGKRAYLPRGTKVSKPSACADDSKFSSKETNCFPRGLPSAHTRAAPS